MAAFILHRLGMVFILAARACGAGGNIVISSRSKLVGEFRVGEETSRHGDEVGFAFTQYLFPSSGPSLPTVMIGDRDRLLEYLRHLRISSRPMMAHVEFFREGT